MYCGLRKRTSKNNPTTLLGQIITYDIAEQQFTSKNIIEYLPYGHDLQRHIDMYYKEYKIH